MRFATVCSGIGAPEVAWRPLGWECAFQAEIEPFPNAVLKHHHPDAPNYGDMTKYKEWPDDRTIDLICAGTPCQAFSVAGLRKGLDDPRGNLTLTFLGILSKYQPRFVVWENVPGVFSEKTGAFDSFIDGLQELGYSVAWTVLDAQYAHLAQRRERVFVVGYLGEQWQYPAAILFDQTCLCWHPAPSRKAGKGFAAEVAPSLTSSGRGVERTGESRGQDPVVAHTLKAEYDASEDGTERGTPLIPTVMAHGQANAEIVSDGSPSLTCNHEAPICFSCKDYGADASEISPTIRAGGHYNSHANAGVMPAVALQSVNTPRDKKENSIGVSESGVMYSRPARDLNGVQIGMHVRRLTPKECARLQGFPDDYLDILYRGKPASDGPKYKALGNSMAVPVLRWIGQRIQSVDNLLKSTNNFASDAKKPISFI